MRYIDIDNWNRKKHFDYFRQLDYPHFSVSANLDITSFYRYIKDKKQPFFISILYAASKTANNIEEFRYRIRGERVVEHASVHPSFTLMTEDEVFSFCTGQFIDGFNNFKNNTADLIEKSKQNVVIEDEPGRDDFLFITCIPWISFTNITHPIHMSPVDSVPRIAWGKYFEDNGRMKLPVCVQVHHALMDGMHVGRYFNKLQEFFDNPEKYLE